MIHRIPSVAALALLCLSGAHAASISAPTYTRVADSTSPNYDLNVTGTQDWQVYEGFSSPIQKLNGNSITLATPVTVVSPCTTEVLGPGAVRSQATFKLFYRLQTQ
jgi:hypothetical protein